MLTNSESIQAQIDGVADAFVLILLAQFLKAKLASTDLRFTVLIE
jgi:hypothetical protein